jgi:hypothetical protein
MFFKVLKSAILTLLLLLFASESFAVATNLQRNRQRGRATQASAERKKEKKNDKERHPFVDSFKKDTLATVLKSRFAIKLPSNVMPAVKDPYDPFAHQAFFRIGQGKTWFFLLSILILGMFIYYRTAFPKQFYQRYRGVFNAYYLEELITDRSLSFTSGSLVCVLFSTFVMAQEGLVVTIYSKYLQLNSLAYFFVVLMGVSLWKLLLYFTQRLQSYVFATTSVSRSLLQRQITIDFWASVVLFPIVNLVYFNASRLKNYPIAEYLLFVVIAWFVLRLIFQLFYLFRENNYSLSNILYFCALEVLPHAILTKALFSISTTP